VSRDWFDPFGIRGSKLDPFVMFTNALRGQGPAGQSAEIIATTIAKRIEGRTVQVDAGLKITATVHAVDEARPPAPLASLPTGSVEIPMWERVRVRLRDIELGEWRIDRVSLDARDLRLIGATSQSVRVGGVDFVATIRPEEVIQWAAAVDGEHRVRVSEGRIEVSDRRLERWAWLEVAVVARDRTILVSPVALRVFDRPLPLLRWLRRTIERDAPWLPFALRVESVSVTESGEVNAVGTVSKSQVPVDVAKLLSDLGTESTKSVLRIVAGEK